MKYLVIKNVRYKGKDIKEGEVIELDEKSEDFLNLKMVGAIDKWQEEVQNEEVKEGNAGEESSLIIKKKKK
jgi:hypothetical protein